MAKILIVDDNPTIRAIAAAALQRAGDQTLPAATGQEALALFSKEKPDLVVLDVELPDAVGYDVCRAMRAEDQDVPVLFLTAHVSLSSRLKGFEAGGQDYIPKPFSTQELRARVHAHLELKHKQEELSRKNCELELQDRMRRDMEDMIVHDLKSPLAAIQATLGIIRQSGLIADSDYRRLLDTSERAAGRLLLMINDLLDVSKAEAGGLRAEFQEVEVCKVLEGAGELLRPMALRCNTKCSVSCPPSIGTIHTDQSFLFRILVNLVSNALRFSRAGDEVLLECARDGKSVRFSVSDRGPGIPDKFKSKVFEKFVQLKKGRMTIQQGTGIGLAFCRLASQAMGAKIWVEDREGGGSRFVLELPV